MRRDVSWGAAENRTLFSCGFPLPPDAWRAVGMTRDGLTLDFDFVAPLLAARRVVGMAGHAGFLRQTC
jgi:hypothetical protein